MKKVHTSHRHSIGLLGTKITKISKQGRSDPAMAMVLAAMAFPVTYPVAK
jgi:hypothetical protein